MASNSPTYRESRERLYCWIDLNVRKQRQLESARVAELRPAPAAIANWPRAWPTTTTDPEARVSGGRAGLQEPNAGPSSLHRRRKSRSSPTACKPTGFPLTAAEARRLQQADPAGAQKTVDLGGGVADGPRLDSRRASSSWAAWTVRLTSVPAPWSRDRRAVLDGRDRDHQRPVRPVRSGARHALHRHALHGPRCARPHRQPPRPARGARSPGRGDALLPVAEPQDGAAGDAAHRGPVGMGRPRRHRDAVLLRHDGHRFRPLRQSGRSVAPLVSTWATTAPAPCSGATPIRRR